MGGRTKLARRVLLVLASVAVVLAGLGVLMAFKRLVPRGPGVVTTTAADFALPDTTGAPVSLASLTAHGPAVLVFYRGFW